MNIISNNCVSGFIQRDILKQAYNNPFIWTTIEEVDMKNLILHFDDIDFENVDLYKDERWNFYIRIDDIVNVNLTHYKFAKEYDKPTIAGPNNNDIFYNRIWEYIVEKYMARVNRMKTQNEKPIFILCGANDRPRYNFGNDYSLDILTEISNKTNYKTIFSFKEMPAEIKNPLCLKVEQPSSFKHNGIDFAHFLYEKCFSNNAS